MERNNAWLTYSAQDMEGLERINSSYKDCLDEGKTERECVAVARRMAQEKGFKDLKDVIRSGEPLKAGDKVYAVCMDKSILLFYIGRKPLQEGMNILGAHIDSPRIDVKQNPLYENEELAYLDTHYYGGIKKYQWVTLPLALHGVVVKKDGTTVPIRIGEKDDDRSITGYRRAGLRLFLAAIILWGLFWQPLWVFRCMPIFLVQFLLRRHCFPRGHSLAQSFPL